MHHLGGGQRFRPPGVLVHLARQQPLVQRAPVHADAHGLAVLQGGLDHRAEIRIPLLADVDVARVDAVFRESLRAVREPFQQQVPVVVEVAHDRRGATEVAQRADDPRHRLGRLVVVDRDADQFGARPRQRQRLVDRRRRVRRVGVGHRLHRDRTLSADPDAADVAGRGRVSANGREWHGRERDALIRVYQAPPRPGPVSAPAPGSGPERR